jgi:hypothetical protein
LFLPLGVYRIISENFLHTIERKIIENRFNILIVENVALISSPASLFYDAFEIGCCSEQFTTDTTANIDGAVLFFVLKYKYKDFRSTSVIK